MQKAKDTSRPKLKAYQIKIEAIDAMIGTSKEEALQHYTEWLNKHMKHWKIIGEPVYIGDAW